MSKNELQLNNHKIRSTGMRLAVLDLFNSSKNALSRQDIELQLSEHDRITLYRTLKTFEDKGLIHKVIDSSNKAKYALCKDGCTDHKHEDQHIHFECVKCLQTSCIQEIPLPKLQMPEEYKVLDVEMMVKGICKSCNHSLL